MKKLIKRIINWYKDFIYDQFFINNCFYSGIDERSKSIDLSKYENRREEIADSTDPIMGIFYIYEGIVIPDYFTEKLMIKENIRLINGGEMYHEIFFEKYMQEKFLILNLCNYDDIPRGRILYGCVLMDKCYLQDKDVQKAIIDIYRLPLDINFFHGGEISADSAYTCSVCNNE